MTSPSVVSGTKKSRLSLDLDEKSKAHLEALCRDSGASTMTEVIKRSLALYELVQEHRRTGGALVFRHADGTEERLVIL
jgi:hypothetical protein